MPSIILKYHRSQSACRPVPPYFSLPPPVAAMGGRADCALLPLLSIHHTNVVLFSVCLALRRGDHEDKGAQDDGPYFCLRKDGGDGGQE